MDRPRLDDPKEFAIIRSIYFEKDNRFNEEIDTVEQLERSESRSRNKNNQAR